MAVPPYNPFAADCSLRYVLITGASMGIGALFAREFAKRGRHLVLVARSAEAMHMLAEELRRSCGVRVEVFPADLRNPGSPERILEFCRLRHTEVDLLINCAGLSRAGDFDDIPPGRIDEIVMVNMMAPAKLIRLFLPDMIAGKKGGIINVASLGGFQGVPGLGLYSATKSFLITLTEALHAELKKSGISVTSVCPGFTDTAIFEHSGHNRTQIRMPVCKPEVVVEAAIKGLMKNRMLVYPTLLDRVLVYSQRVASRGIAIGLAGFFAGIRSDR
ncbi:SDR family NAD(P)-dependent oxidoreductase [Chlorobium ferrooxidans]|uniref:Short-chain dehydrogenase/reductase SDR n=1 Tax=Chlorobium ferrooxidans DSM 13031 TaxID=377431 RepID=Q0YP41_9CHLB|nr:SDR family oxidoreductase [Chlorobium ferrooxidans]EAT58069.1 Short-chain dehydrogenase/reductase SDR [Chlorobium ferrooxidans DSM 13031]